MARMLFIALFVIQRLEAVLSSYKHGTKAASFPFHMVCYLVDLTIARVL